jgi:hypothetical protein
MTMASKFLSRSIYIMMCKFMENAKKEGKRQKRMKNWKWWEIRMWEGGGGKSVSWNNAPVQYLVSSLIFGDITKYSWSFHFLQYQITRYIPKAFCNFTKNTFKSTKTPFKISHFYYNTAYSVFNIYKNTIYCHPCQHFTDTLVHHFIPIIKNEDYTLVVMATILFLPSSTNSDHGNHLPIFV